MSILVFKRISFIALVVVALLISINRGRTYDRGELVPVITELWLGYTHEIKDSWQLSAVIRARNSEIDISTINDPV